MALIRITKKNGTILTAATEVQTTISATVFPDKAVAHSKAKECAYCKHQYTNPCNGTDLKCPNKLFLDSNSQ